MQLAGLHRRRPGAAGRRPQRRPEARPGGDGDAARARPGRRARSSRPISTRCRYRGEIVGIEALAQTLFGKHPSGLDAHEAAIAAALVRGPNAKPADGRRARLRRAASCSGSTAPASTASPRRRSRGAARMPLGEQLAPHFARQCARPGGRAGAGAARSTRGLQRFAVDAAAPPARRARRQERRGRRRRRARQRERRGAGLGRLERRSLRRGARSTACSRGASRARR